MKNILTKQSMKAFGNSHLLQKWHRGYRS